MWSAAKGDKIPQKNKNDSKLHTLSTPNENMQ